MSKSVADDVRLGHGHAGTVDVAVVDHVATLTMRNGEQNRFNTTTVGRINAALDKVLSNPDVQALVVMGEGRFFSSGLDLPWIQYLGQTGQTEQVVTFLESFLKLVTRVLTFPMPTVAVINGHAAAGGALFALACDVRIMRRDRGYYYINEVRIGLHIKGNLKELVLCKIPQGEALTDAVIFGKRLTGPDTLRLGITSALCEEHELQRVGHQTARNQLADGAFMRETLGKNKEIMYSRVLEATIERTKGPLSSLEYVNALSKSKM